MKVTLQAVAERAGVSMTTASFVLNGRAGAAIPEATRERVRRAARELAYRPNRIARSLATGRTHTLGFVLVGLTNAYYAELAEAFHHVARARGYDLLLALSEGRPDQERQQIEWLLDRHVDGLLLWSVSRTRASLSNSLRRQRVPHAFLCSAVHESATDFVALDTRDGVLRAIAHLLALGHSQIGFVGEGVDTGSGRTNPKYLAYHEGLERAGRKPVPLSIPSIGDVSAHACRTAGYEAAAGLAGRADRPTAVLCQNDLIALGLLRGLKDQRLRVPEDVAVVGFDGISEGAFSDPRLTTVAQPVREMARMGVEVLLRRIADPDREPEQIMLECELEVRESCGAGRRRAATSSASAGPRKRLPAARERIER